MVDIVFFIAELICLAIHVVDEVKRYKKGVYNPIIFRMRNESESNMRDFLNYFGMCISGNMILARGLQLIFLLLLMITSLILISTLNVKCYIQSRNRRIIYEIIVMYGIYAIVLYFVYKHSQSII
ncbi:hypothetical protein IZY60_13630 [Lutibacter sp. B2]|nr:hypothetical protein [Lutibacter sp. B2]